MSATEGTAIPADLRVLLVEDEERDARLILRELANTGFRVQGRRVVDAGGLRAAVGEGSWDVALSEYAVLGFGFEEAVGDPRWRQCRRCADHRLGGIGERALAAAGGYVGKGRHRDDLGAAVRGSLATHAARRPRKAELARLAQADGAVGAGSEAAALDQAGWRARAKHGCRRCLIAPIAISTNVSFRSTVSRLTGSEIRPAWRVRLGSARYATGSARSRSSSRLGTETAATTTSS
ncbi:MAG: hypothetical protein ABSG43_26670 [Solirubrobacteraceae bacterium]